MNCTATTRLTAEECLARLDALRPMPRGERTVLRMETLNDQMVPAARLWVHTLWNSAPGTVIPDREYDWPMTPDIRRWAAPVRRLREERRALREALADVVGSTCEKFGRYCLTHQNKDCRADEARKLLGWDQ